MAAAKRSTARAHERRARRLAEANKQLAMRKAAFQAAIRSDDTQRIRRTQDALTAARTAALKPEVEVR